MTESDISVPISPPPAPSLVHWMPWGEDALVQAESEGKPIFLSIGYAVCHWCQLMDAESFCDPTTAALMNRWFINIKVDRDERPDLDEIYQLGHRILTNHPGGWPLTAFLCPRTRLPFLIGTYFPRNESEGRMAFSSLLEKVKEYYNARGTDFVDTLDKVRAAYDETAANTIMLDSDAEFSRIPIDRSLVDLMKYADHVRGGFGSSPKFLMPSSLEHLYFSALNHQPEDDVAKTHLSTTLLTMAQSGINDQVGGGFFRYAIDEQWMIPHFEKVLNDNSQMLAVYAEAWQMFKHKSMAWAAESIVTWVERELVSPLGGFYSSTSADSKGGSAKGYYLWSREELNQVLNAGERAIVFAVYDLDKYPNIGEHWHLHRARTWAEVSIELELSEAEIRRLLNDAQQKLLWQRQTRSALQCDEKIIVSWNGLLIRGLAIYSRVFHNNHGVKLAQQAVDFIRRKLWRNNALAANWQTGNSKGEAFADDYLFLMDGLFELLRVEWRESDYQFLISLAETVINNYLDVDNGGLFLSQYQNLVYRPKPFVDKTIPATNGVAAKVFNRLGHFCGEPRYLEYAKNILLCGWGSALRAPLGHHNYLMGLAEFFSPPLLVLLKGAEQQRWQQCIQDNYGDLVHCFWVPGDADICPPELLSVEEGEAVIYADGEAMEPITELDVLTKELAKLIFQNQQESS